MGFNCERFNLVHVHRPRAKEAGNSGKGQRRADRQRGRKTEQVNDEGEPHSSYERDE